MGKSSVVSTEVKLYNGVYNALIVGGMNPAGARTYAHFAMDVYAYIEDDPQLQGALAGLKSVYKGRKEANEAVVAFRYVLGARDLNLSAGAARFAAKGTVAMAGVIPEFVNYCAALAKINGIEMNECAISVTTVMLDVLTVVAMADTVVGVWAAAMQALSTVNDSREMVNMCLSGS